MLIFICLLLVLICPRQWQQNLAQLSRTVILSFTPIIHHNPPRTMRTNFFLNNNILTNSPHRNQEIDRALRNIGQIKNEVNDVFSDHEWAVVIL